ncbi:MAG: TonB-dependent receptor [Steroidobacteraceae bacterium]
MELNERSSAAALRSLLSASVALALGSLAAPAALAQDSGTQVGGIEDIVVTARKREESVQDVPVSVSAITGEQSQKLDLTSLEKLAVMTPQLSVGRAASGSGAQLTLRGIGSNISSIAIEQSVATVVDGVYYGQGRIINEGFFDLGRVELLKGPQALFFGKNATAGVVSITTAQPTRETEFMARAGYEFKAQQVYAEAVGSGPLSDTLGLRVAVRGADSSQGLFRNRATSRFMDMRDTSTGTATNPAAVWTRYTAEPSARYEGSQELIGRATLKWEPSDDLDAMLQLGMSRSQFDDPGFNNLIYVCPAPSGTSQLDIGAACPKDFAFSHTRWPKEVAAVVPYAGKNGALYNKYRSWYATNTVNYDAGDIAFAWVNNYNWNRNRWAGDSDYQASSRTTAVLGTPRYITNTMASENTRYYAYSSELRAMTRYDGPANIMLGVYYQKSRRDFGQWIVTGGRENSAASAANRYIFYSKDSDTTGKTLSPFGQLTVKVGPKVEAAAGVRYTHETRDSHYVMPYTNPEVRAIYPMNSPLVGDQTFNNWSPEASLTYKPVDDVTVYAAYKTAYKSGGFSISGTQTATAVFAFEPERAKGFEGGIKSVLLDRQLRLNLGAYHYVFKNLQLDFFDAATFANITTNAGSAKTDGVELEFEYAPMALAGFDLHGSINYNDARYGNYLSPCYAGQSLAQGCVVGLFKPGVNGQQLAGVATSVAPKWTGSLGATYETPVSGNLNLGLTVDSRYSSGYIASVAGNPISRQKRYLNLNAAVRVATADDHWEFAVIGKNLTNNYVINGEADSPSSGGAALSGILADQRGYVGSPRTFQVQVTWRN